MIRIRRAAAILALLTAGCGSGYEGPPVVVIGMDGLEWSVLGPLVVAGRAPNFAALIARGTAGALATDVPTLSPVVWTSIATGVRPFVHGIRFFSETDARGEPREDGLPYTSNSRAAPAIWNVAAENDRRVLAVAWWVSWPAEALRHGRVVSSYAAQAQGKLLWSGDAAGGFPEHTWPPELAEEIAPAIHAGRPDGPLAAEYAAAFGTVPAEWPRDARMDSVFRATYHADRTHLRVFVDQLRADPADLNLVYFGLPDIAGHFWWRYHEPAAYPEPAGPRKVEALGPRLEATYEQVDAWLGEILAAAPAQSRILLLSDHGMHALPDAGPRAVQNGGHDDAPPGVLILAGPQVRERGLLPAGARELGSIYDVMPTLLDWLELPPAAGLPGRSLRQLMGDAWGDAHPPRQPRNYAKGFRAATPPRAPTEHAAEIFLKTFLDDIGYAGGAEFSDD
ncbi:MAG TPA: alkaline phosphatase family protein [Planctomycetota bacterium]